MTIYVDELRKHVVIQPSAEKYGRSWCHMATDGDIEELHLFAERIGMKRAWFQNHASVPHYDLVPNRRKAAIAAGAVSVSSVELVRNCSTIIKKLDL